MREGVLAVLDALRTGIGAEAIGLFDDDRAETGAGRAQTPPNFWDAFGELPCAGLDWRAFYLELKTTRSVDLRCACEVGHRLHGFLLHGRWVLLLVAPPALAPGAAAVIASAVKALADKLPPARPEGTTGAGTPHPADDDGFADAPSRMPVGGAPLWWVRKARQ
jgi:hypothetical protein